LPALPDRAEAGPDHGGASLAAPPEGDRAGAAGVDAGAAEIPAQPAEEERPPEPAKPKKRGWWSLGL
jgi:hypothetical protein